MKLLKKYIEGNLSKEELETVSEQLLTAKLDRDKRKEWKQKLSQEYDIEKLPKTKKVILLRRRMLVNVGVASILILGLFFLVPKYFQDPLANELATQIDQLSSIMSNQSVLRKDEIKTDKIRRNATLSYINNDYKKSIEFWEKLNLTKSSSGMDQFYLALCHLQKANSEPQKTIEILELYRTNDSLYAYQNEINWVLALAYLKNSNFEKAQELLKSIIKNKAYMNQQAEVLLNVIKKQ